MVKHISGWIIEGVVASGKTTFIKELQQCNRLIWEFKSKNGVNLINGSRENP